MKRLRTGVVDVIVMWLRCGVGATLHSPTEKFEHAWLEAEAGDEVRPRFLCVRCAARLHGHAVAH